MTTMSFADCDRHCDQFHDHIWNHYGMTLGSGTTFGYMVGRDLARAETL